jgi:hypothetical protein
LERSWVDQVERLTYIKHVDGDPSNSVSESLSLVLSQIGKVVELVEMKEELGKATSEVQAQLDEQVRRAERVRTGTYAEERPHLQVVRVRPEVN